MSDPQPASFGNLVTAAPTQASQTALAGPLATASATAGPSLSVPPASLHSEASNVGN